MLTAAREWKLVVYFEGNSTARSAETNFCCPLKIFLWGE